MVHTTDLEIFIKVIDNKIKEMVLEEGVCIALDKKAIAHNINFYQNFGTEVGAVVKADAYGCGVDNLVPIFLENGISSFFVHNVKEGINIRKLCPHSDIFILAPIISNKNFNLIEKYRLIPIIYDVEGLEEYVNHPSAYKKFGLHVETGINRNGIPFADIDEIKKLIDGLVPEIMISHIGSTEKDTAYNDIHTNTFEHFKKAINNCKKYSLYASESAFFGKNIYQEVYDMLRIGIGFFGINVSKNAEEKLENAICIFSKILQIKQIKKGDYVGYLAKFVADRDMYIGIVNFGYNDGLPRFNSQQVYFSFKNHQIPVLGITSMDLACVEVPNHLVKEIAKEPIVEIFGNNSKIQDLCKKNDLNPLEIVTRFKRYSVLVK